MKNSKEAYRLNIVDSLNDDRTIELTIETDVLPNVGDKVELLTKTNEIKIATVKERVFMFANQYFDFTLVVDLKEKKAILS